MRPRLSVFRSARHIYAQAIADEQGRTLVAASTLSEDLKSDLAKCKKSEAAKKVGQLVAKLLLEKGISEVIFRSGPVSVPWPDKISCGWCQRSRIEILISDVMAVRNDN